MGWGAPARRLAGVLVLLVVEGATPDRKNRLPFVASYLQRCQSSLNLHAGWLPGPLPTLLGWGTATSL